MPSVNDSMKKNGTLLPLATATPPPLYTTLTWFVIPHHTKWGTMLFVVVLLAIMSFGFSSAAMALLPIGLSYASSAAALSGNTSTDSEDTAINSKTSDSHPCAKILNALDDQYNQHCKPHHSKQPGWTGKKRFDLFELEATGFREERFGSESDERFDAFGDGPNFVCGMDVIAVKAKADNANSGDSPGCLVFSVGSNNDIQFEKAIHTHMKGCEIHTFDPKIDVLDSGFTAKPARQWQV